MFLRNIYTSSKSVGILWSNFLVSLTFKSKAFFIFQIFLPRHSIFYRTKALKIVMSIKKSLKFGKCVPSVHPFSIKQPRSLNRFLLIFNFLYKIVSFIIPRYVELFNVVFFFSILSLFIEISKLHYCNRFFSE